MARCGRMGWILPPILLLILLVQDFDKIIVLTSSDERSIPISSTLVIPSPLPYQTPQLKNSTPSSSNGLCPAAQKLKISILTYSNAQSHFDRNSVLNACYQDYPHDLIELLIAETSPEPSPLYLQAVKTPPCGKMNIRHKWWNSTILRGKGASPNLGQLRNIMSNLAVGDILINMDNDDFYHPDYAHAVVKAMVCNKTRKHDVVFVGNHASMHFNPDGTRSMHPPRNPIMGSHLTSVTKNLSKICKVFPSMISEELGLHKCLTREKVSTVRIVAEKLGYSSLLLVKTANAMSITNQKHFLNRDEYSRLSRPDWKSAFLQQEFAMEEMHELTRPKHIAAWYAFGDNKTFDELRLKQAKDKLSWRKWHKTHKDFYSGKTAVGLSCEGFASMPGQSFPGNGKGERLEVETAKSATECCQRCRPIRFVANGQANETCSAFTFCPRTHNCKLFIVVNDTRVRLPGALAYKPGTLFSEYMFGRIEAYPKILDGVVITP